MATSASAVLLPGVKLHNNILWATHFQGVKLTPGQNRVDMEWTVGCARENVAPLIVSIKGILRKKRDCRSETLIFYEFPTHNPTFGG